MSLKLKLPREEEEEYNSVVSLTPGLERCHLSDCELLCFFNMEKHSSNARENSHR